VLCHYITTAQCDSTNSPTFLITVNQVTLATNGICGAQIFIQNMTTSPPGGPVSYSLFAPGQSTLMPPPPPPTIITTTGTWTVYVKDNTNLCVSIKTIQINALQAANLSIVASTSVCAGSLATLSAIGANTYTWSTGAKTASILVNPLSSQTYSVIGTGTNACANAAAHALNVTVNPLPNLNVSPSQINICLNQSITLTASGANTYSWTTSQTDSLITVTPSVNTIYAVYSTNAFGCTATKQIMVSVSACTDIKDLKNNYDFFFLNKELTVFPNPADGYVILKLLKEAPIDDDLIISIFNHLAQIVKVIAVEDYENDTVVTTSDLTDGIYFLQVQKGKNTVATKKLIVHH